MSDNGINRRGQKVECTAQFDVVTHTDAKLAMPTPVPGKVYTVDDFVLSGKVVGFGESDTAPGVRAPGITLNEVATPACKCCGQVMGWPIVGFRPVTHPDSKAAFSALVDAAAKVTLPKREDAKAFFQGGIVTLSPWPVVGERPGESLLTPRPHFADQGEAAIEACAILDAAVDQAADEIARAFIRTYVIPLLVKRLGL